MNKFLALACLLLSGWTAAADKKSLVVYTNQLAYGTLLVEGFAKTHPEYDVKQMKMGPVEDFKSAMFTENAAERADVMLRCQEPMLQFWVMNGILSQFPDGSLIAPVVGAPHIIVYNSKLVEEAQAPRTLADLVKPEWKGRAVMRNPVMGNTGAFLAEYVGARDPKLTWYRDMAAQNVFVADTPQQVIDAVATGNRAVALMRDVEFLPVAKDHPHLKMLFIEDKLPYQYQVAVLNKLASNPAGAREFAAWVLNDGQKLLADAGYSVGDREKELLKRPHWKLDIASTAMKHSERLVESLRRLHSGAAQWPHSPAEHTAKR